MRKWHRWLSLIFGVFMLWIAATGVLSQLVPLVQNGGFEGNQRPSPAASSQPADRGRDISSGKQPVRRGPGILGTLHHLHSGESFGVLGQIISILSGLSLIFFSFSGLWMYVQMYRGRLAKVHNGKSVRGKGFFW